MTSRSSLNLTLLAVACMSVGVLVGVLLIPKPLTAAKEPDRFAPPRIAYVNIARVLREYTKANMDSAKITKKRQEYAEKVKPLSDQLAAKGREIQALVNPAEIEALQQEAQVIRKQLDEITEKARVEIEAMTDHVIVEVYQAVRAVVANLVKEHGLDVVELYPDVSQEADHAKPAIAQAKLQSPGLVPFHIRKELDLTDEVIAALNKARPSK